MAVSLVFSHAEVGGVPSDDDMGIILFFQDCWKSANLFRNCEHPNVLGHA